MAEVDNGGGDEDSGEERDYGCAHLVLPGAAAIDVRCTVAAAASVHVTSTGSNARRPPSPVSSSKPYLNFPIIQ